MTKELEALLTLGSASILTVVILIYRVFVQIAEQIENDIISGALPEESQVPSTR